MSDFGDDLRGYSWVGDDGLTYTVLQIWDYTAGYMLCRVGPNDTAIRPIHAIRQRMQSETRTKLAQLQDDALLNP